MKEKTKKTNKAETCFFRNINTIGKPLSRLIDPLYHASSSTLSNQPITGAQQIFVEGMLVLTGAVLATDKNRYDAIKHQLTFIECTPCSESFMWIFTFNVYLHT